MLTSDQYCFDKCIPTKSVQPLVKNISDTTKWYCVNQAGDPVCGDKESAYFELNPQNISDCGNSLACAQGYVAAKNNVDANIVFDTSNPQNPFAQYPNLRNQWKAGYLKNSISPPEPTGNITLDNKLCNPVTLYKGKLDFGKNATKSAGAPQWTSNINDSKRRCNWAQIAKNNKYWSDYCTKDGKDVGFRPKFDIRNNKTVNNLCEPHDAEVGEIWYQCCNKDGYNCSTNSEPVLWVADPLTKNASLLLGRYNKHNLCTDAGSYSHDGCDVNGDNCSVNLQNIMDDVFKSAF